MEKRLDAIDVELIGIRNELKIIAVNSGIQNEQLKEHMRRTEAVEENNMLLKELLDLQKKELDKKIEPLKDFVAKAKFLGAVAGVVGSLFIGLAKLGLIHLGL